MANDSALEALIKTLQNAIDAAVKRDTIRYNALSMRNLEPQVRQVLETTDAAARFLASGNVNADGIAKQLASIAAADSAQDAAFTKLTGNSAQGLKLNDMNGAPMVYADLSKAVNPVTTVIQPGGAGAGSQPDKKTLDAAKQIINTPMEAQQTEAQNIADGFVDPTKPRFNVHLKIPYTAETNKSFILAKITVDQHGKSTTYSPMEFAAAAKNDPSLYQDFMHFMDNGSPNITIGDYKGTIGLKRDFNDAFNYINTVVNNAMDGKATNFLNGDAYTPSNSEFAFIEKQNAINDAVSGGVITPAEANQQMKQSITDEKAFGTAMTNLDTAKKANTVASFGSSIAPGIAKGEQMDANTQLNQTKSVTDKLGVQVAGMNAAEHQQLDNFFTMAAANDASIKETGQSTAQWNDFQNMVKTKEATAAQSVVDQNELAMARTRSLGGVPAIATPTVDTEGIRKTDTPPEAISLPPPPVANIQQSSDATPVVVAPPPVVTNYTQASDGPAPDPAKLSYLNQLTGAGMSVADATTWYNTGAKASDAITFYNATKIPTTIPPSASKTAPNAIPTSTTPMLRRIGGPQ